MCVKSFIRGRGCWARMIILTNFLSCQANSCHYYTSGSHTDGQLSPEGTGWSMWLFLVLLCGSDPGYTITRWPGSAIVMDSDFPLLCFCSGSCVWGCRGSLRMFCSLSQAAGAVREADVPASSGLWKKSRRTALEKGLLWSYPAH